MNRFWSTPMGALFLALISSPALAKKVDEAVRDMGDVQNSDPSGYTLMIVSISILFFVALSLIGVTVWYMYRGKKKPQ